MNRAVALLVVIAMANGCATYQGARTARNVGAVMTVTGLVLTVAGAVLSSQQESQDGCTGDCDGVISPGGLGIVAVLMTGIGLLGYGVPTFFVGAAGMETHDPHKERVAAEQAELDRIARERIELGRANLSRAVAERERERERLEREAAKNRETAFALLKTATEAARAQNCAPALELEAQVRELDANVHDAWFVRDPAIKRCLTALEPPP